MADDSDKKTGLHKPVHWTNKYLDPNDMNDPKAVFNAFGKVSEDVYELQQQIEKLTERTAALEPAKAKQPQDPISARVRKSSSDHSLE